MNEQMKVRVGLDQWVLTSNQHNKEYVDLVTKDLTGCVALALASKNQRFLAHVFSDCNENNGNFNDYARKLQVPLEAMQDKVKEKENKDIDAALVYSQGTSKWLPEKLSEWLRVKGVRKIETYEASGCRLQFDSQLTWGIQEKESDNPDFYNAGEYTCTASKAGKKRIDDYGNLSHHGQDAGAGDDDGANAKNSAK